MQRAASKTYERRFVDLLPTVHRIAGQFAAVRHLSSLEAEEFRARAEDKLMEDDYRVLRDHRGDASLETYLAVILRRLLNDYCDHLWGRWRPSRYAQRHGPVAVELDRAVNAERLTFDEAFARLQQRGIDRETAWKWYEHVRRAGREHLVAPDNTDWPNPAPPADEVLAGEQRRESVDGAAQRIGTIFRSLAPEDRLLLHFFDLRQLPMRSVATMLGGNPKRLYRKRETLLKKIRRELLAAGLTAEDDLAEFLDLLGEQPAEEKR